MSELDSAAAKWYNFGLALGVSSSHLDAIKEDYGTVADCLREMLNYWLKNADQPTWERVAEALGRRTVSRRRLAQSIRGRHCGVVGAAQRPHRSRRKRRAQNIREKPFGAWRIVTE